MFLIAGDSSWTKYYKFGVLKATQTTKSINGASSESVGNVRNNNMKIKKLSITS